MTGTNDYLDNHPKSYLQHWSNQLWLGPRETDRPFTEGEIFQNCLTLSWQGLTVFFLVSCMSCLWSCILSVDEVWADPCPKASFAKKKTSSIWSVFGAQFSLGNKSVLPGAIMSQFIRTLSYLNAIFYSSLK